MAIQRRMIGNAEALELSSFQSDLLSSGNFAAWLAELKRRKEDPEHAGYVQRLREGAEEARRQIDEEVRRQMDEEAGK